MKLKLGINAGFAINRFPEPDVWLKIVGKDLGLHYVQFVADLLNPFLPERWIRSQIERINENAKRYDVKIDTTFTSAFTRVNHLMHPDAEVREIWFEWFKRFFAISRDLGVRGSGSHFGIMSVRDFNNLERREYLFSQAIEYWQELSRYGANLGFKFLMFEPMSVPRECGATISQTEELLEKLNRDIPIPILLCLDVDHGDIGSLDPKDRDPYVWLEEFGRVSPVVHIKQSLADKSGHWPFINRYNELGIIHPERVIDALERSGANDVVLTFEISHRERYPTEYQVLNDLKESVEYWRRYVKD
ncbi:MAG: sugar phosphate isomerase/epimerase family protein [bacterium]